MTRVNSTGKESSSNFSPANGTGLAVRTALKDILESIRTINSASGDPSGTANLAAYQMHIDSDTNLLKIRNGANSAFIELGNISQANFGLLPLSGGTMTGVLGLSNATASAPSVHFGDSTTGLFRKASNQIGFTFAGTEKLFVDQNGLFPTTTNNVDLGSSSLRFANLFINDLNLSNEGHKNDVDMTWGSYTIQEGLNDLFLINNRTNKKFKFVLEEVSLWLLILVMVQLLQAVVL